VHAADPTAHTHACLLASLPTEGTTPSVRQLVDWAGRIAAAGVATAVGRPPRALRDAIDSVDLLVLIGGSNIFDTGRRPPMGTLRLLQSILPALVARRRGTPYVLLGHTLGPVKTRVGRRLLRSVVGNAGLTVVREAHSADFVRDELHLEPGERLQVAPDLAFALEPTRTPRLDEVLAPLRDTRFAVLVPRSYHHPDPARDDRLVGELTALGRAALDAGMVDTVLVFAQCSGPTPIEDDRVTAARIAGADPRFRLVDVDLGPGEVAELYRHATFVVAVRLHAVILALSVGTPVHGIEYFTNKTRGVFAQFGLAGHWSEFDSFDADDALKRIKDLLSPDKLEFLRSRAAEMRAGVRAIEMAHLVT
jgi:polysaccharide pyruvyl transferase WcaK-like protein